MDKAVQRNNTKMWLIICVVFAGLLAIAAVGWGAMLSAEYEREADSYARQYADYTDKKIIQNCRKLAPVSGQDCAAQARHEQRSNERSERELVAQRQSAIWAYIMGAAAVVGMGFSTIGIILVWTTFRETQRGAKAATDAANYAQETLKSERAWMIHHINHVSRGSVDLGQGRIGNGMVLQIEWINNGRSMAQEILTYAECKAVPRDEPDPVFAVRDMGQDFAGAVIGAGKTILTVPQFVIDEEFSAFMRGEIKIFLFGIVKYKTLQDYPQIHTTQCCMEILYLADSKDGVFRTHIRYAKHQNTAD